MANWWTVYPFTSLYDHCRYKSKVQQSVPWLVFETKLQESAMDQRYLKVLRRKRVLLLRELPDIETLMKTPELWIHFTAYERSEILSDGTFGESFELCQCPGAQGARCVRGLLGGTERVQTGSGGEIGGSRTRSEHTSTASSPVSNGSAASVSCEWCFMSSSCGLCMC